MSEVAPLHVCVFAMVSVSGAREDDPRLRQCVRLEVFPDGAARFTRSIGGMDGGSFRFGPEVAQRIGHLLLSADAPLTSEDAA